MAKLPRFRSNPNMQMGWEEKLTMAGLPYYYNAETEEITWEKPDALRTPEEIAALSGDWVWIPHPKDLWQPARILSRTDTEVVCETEDGTQVRVPANGKMESSLTGYRKVKVEFWPMKHYTLEATEEDLVMLDGINDAMIINNLRRRFEKKNIYTWVGAGHSILVVINPYKIIPGLYGEEQIRTYYNPPPNVALDPHVYAVATNSYRDLAFNGKNQSILISGESGAGKTVATKHCLNFLALIAGSERDTEEKIIAANPLLEAFGNAQTIRNNNSSRFGKWIEVYFENRKSEIVSASITNYLLEKSRLVYQQAGERNFHIFYQLMSDPAVQSKYALTKPQDYRYTNQSGTFVARDIDDSEEWTAVKDAMGQIGFSESEQEFVISVTAGVLFIGNCVFDSKMEAGSVEGSKLKDRTPMQQAAKLLCLPEEALEKVLSYRSITVRGNTDVIPLSPLIARSSADSLAMGIYSNLFDWLVRRINDSLEGEKGKFIGILDIFGFEIFEQNSFEQLNINFANEKLQQQFNRTTFKEEEALYQAERIDYKHIEFIDNQIVLDLIELKPSGILPMLDDECIVPKGSDVGFMNKIEEAHFSNDKFQTDTKRKLEDSFNFEILHYAGVVQYNGEGFLKKNTDSLFQDMYDLLTQSTHEHMKNVFPVNETSQRGRKSISYQFRQQLNALMEVVYKTESRYIRCVKPNGKQIAHEFESPLVIDQLRYSGVFEAVEIRKQGYPFRYKYGQFACRYMCINRGHRYRAGRKDYRAITEELLDVNKQDFSGVVFGETIAFYRTAEHKTLELLRELALETLIPKMQSIMRGGLAREVRRRCLALQEKLAAALVVGNDIAMLQSALDEVKPTLRGEMESQKHDDGSRRGNMSAVFPGVVPLNLRKAEAHRDDLQKWKDLEARLETLLGKDPNKVYYELADACETAIELDGIPQTQHQKDLVRKAHEARETCTLGKIDREAKECLAVLDPERMRAVQARAVDNNHSNKELKEIDRLLSLPEIEFVQLEMDKAKEMDDQERFIHREIRYKELYLDENAAKYKRLDKYPELREPLNEYAKASFLNKISGAQKAADNMLNWTKGLPPTSLTKMEKPMVKQAKLIAKSIRQYMGDKKIAEADVAAQKMLETASMNKLEDETYLQLMKQLTNNPTPESVSKGWELMGLVCSTFIPSSELENYVVMFLRDYAPDNDYKRFTAALHETEYSKKSGIPGVSGVASLIKAFTEGEGRSRYSVAEGDPTGPK